MGSDHNCWKKFSFYTFCPSPPLSGVESKMVSFDTTEFYHDFKNLKERVGFHQSYYSYDYDKIGGFPAKQA